MFATERTARTLDALQISYRLVPIVIGYRADDYDQPIYMPSPSRMIISSMWCWEEDREIDVKELRAILARILRDEHRKKMMARPKVEPSGLMFDEPGTWLDPLDYMLESEDSWDYESVREAFGMTGRGDISASYYDNMACSDAWSREYWTRKYRHREAVKAEYHRRHDNS